MRFGPLPRAGEGCVRAPDAMMRLEGSESRFYEAIRYCALTLTLILSRTRERGLDYFQRSVSSIRDTFSASRG